MLARSFRLGVFPVCMLAGLLVVAGCSARRNSQRVPRHVGRVYHNVSPNPVADEEPEYNPPTAPERQAPVPEMDSEPTPHSPPAPRDADPPPPTTRSTSDLPPAPPRDDFESAEKPGRHSASFGPYTGRVQRVASSSNRPGIDL